jgi:hypothetical protein
MKLLRCIKKNYTFNDARKTGVHDTGFSNYSTIPQFSLTFFLDECQKKVRKFHGSFCYNAQYEDPSPQEQGVSFRKKTGRKDRTPALQDRTILRIDITMKCRM